MAAKYQDTKKAKAQADKMSAEIAKKLGYDSPKTKTAPTPKATKKPVITPRKRIDVSKMTPAQKAAYYAQQGYDNY
jgi:hypothetical protein